MKLIKQFDLIGIDVIIKVHHDINMNPETYIISVYLKNEFIEDSTVKNIKFLNNQIQAVTSKWLNIVHLLR